jgi:hypothetical protein
MKFSRTSLIFVALLAQPFSAHAVEVNGRRKLGQGKGTKNGGLADGFPKSTKSEKASCSIEDTDDLTMGGSLNACVGTGKGGCGKPRFVPADEACDSDEVPVEWNIAGPTGN